MIRRIENLIKNLEDDDSISNFKTGVYSLGGFAFGMAVNFTLLKLVYEGITGQPLLNMDQIQILRVKSTSFYRKSRLKIH